MAEIEDSCQSVSVGGMAADMSLIDHKFTEDIVCPHCGHVHVDSWEWGGGEEGDWEDYECECCENKFNWSRHVKISYSTSLPEDQTNNEGELK
jgi:hypothetical protein